MKLNYFKLSDFNCKETGKNEMQESFLLRLDALREACGFPFIITSGYRAPEHSIESKKLTPGTHAQGIASDIRANNVQAYIIMREAFKMDFGGIALGDRFVHIDDRDSINVTWRY